MFYIIYEITNLVNGKIYVGAHKAKNVNDTYMGSGVAIKRAIKKYGKSNFSKKILFTFDNESDMWRKEAELVSEQFITRPDVYNQCVGGGKPPNPWKCGELMVIDTFGKRFIVSNTDPRYISGELTHVGSRKGLIMVIHTLTGERKSVTIDQLDNMKSAGWQAWAAGFMRYKDQRNKSYYLPTNDQLINELSLVPWTKGKKVMKLDDQVVWVDSDKVTPDMQSIKKNCVSVRDSSGKNYSVRNDDPRYTSGELVAVNSGKTGLANHLNTIKYTCQHCNMETTKGNYTRWHGINCKKNQ